MACRVLSDVGRVEGLEVWGFKVLEVLGVFMGLGFMGLGQRGLGRSLQGLEDKSIESCIVRGSTPILLLKGNDNSA